MSNGFTVQFFRENLPDEWWELLKDQIQIQNFDKLVDNIVTNEEFMYPPLSKVFRALELCSVSNVKGVIIGQDPYYVKDQANGLAFSCETGENQPSLSNILKEVQAEFKEPLNQRLKNCDLSFWAEQGVLLLNSSLTVSPGRANSHSHFGWKSFTDMLIRVLSSTKSHLFFMLWGSFAHKLEDCINAHNHHLILKSSHPSPMSVTRATKTIPSFRGNGHFRQANFHLKSNGCPEIVWI